MRAALARTLAACVLGLFVNHVAGADEAAPRSAQVLVVRRGWHIDVGFAVADLEGPLNAIATDLPQAKFIFFGFGDMHYLLAKNHGSSTMAAALWPGRGIMLVTGIANTPPAAFGGDSVVELEVSGDDARVMQDSIWSEFVRIGDVPSVYRQGPYEGSLYFLANDRYSASHTCNTWAAEVLEAGRLPIRSGRIHFAGPLWKQVKRAERAQHSAPSVAPNSNSAD